MSEAKTSSWIALQNPAFSKLWFATLTSGICVSAKDTADTWMLNSTSHSTLLLSLMSTAEIVSDLRQKSSMALGLRRPLNGTK